MTYTATVGEDAHWTTIDDVDMKTEFQAGGTSSRHRPIAAIEWAMASAREILGSTTSARASTVTGERSTPRREAASSAPRAAGTGSAAST